MQNPNPNIQDVQDAARPGTYDHQTPADSNTATSITIDLNRFEIAWQSGRVPDLEAFLPGVDAGGLARRRIRSELLIELIMVDLEYRWKRATGAPSQSTDPVAMHSGRALPDRPRIEDYLFRFPELESPGPHTVQLLAEEFRVRNKWGDRPTIDQYVARFPHLETEIRAARIEVSEELPGMTAKLFYAKQLVYALRIHSRAEFGRQQSGELPSCCHSETEDGIRIVMAPSHDRSISRRLLTVEFGTSLSVTLTNHSNRNWLHIDHAEPLRPLETRHVTLPVLLSVGEHAIRLEAE